MAEDRDDEETERKSDPPADSEADSKPDSAATSDRDEAQDADSESEASKAGGDDKDPATASAKASDGEDSETGEPEEASTKKSDSDDDDGDDGERPSRPSVSAPPPEPRPEGAAWARPLVRFDKFWTRFEARLCAAVLGLEIFSLGLWVCLKGMSARSDLGSNAGVVFRGVVAAIALGSLGYFALKSKGRMAQRIAGMTGILIGIFTAKLWANVLVDYSSNWLNWYQQASSFTLVGGLRGVGTRLTLLLMLLGGSLATAAGKHITIDVVTRILKDRHRKWVTLVGWFGTSVICFVAAWGFFDFVAIQSFDANAEYNASAANDSDDAPAAEAPTPGHKLSMVGEGLGEKWFILRKQLSLDMKTIPHVFMGEPYSKYLKGTEYNQWIDDAGFAERYGKESAEKLKIKPDQIRAPMVVIPEKGEPRGELSHAANLVFPIGLLIIALRFLLLCVLVLSGHRTVDPDDDESRTHGKEDLDPEDQTPEESSGDAAAELEQEAA